MGWKDAPVVEAAGSAGGSWRDAPTVKRAVKRDGPFVPSGEKTSGWLGGIFGYDPKALGITPAENIAAHPITRFATGAASPVLGAAQLADEATGGNVGVSEHLKKLEGMKRTGMDAMGAEGMDVTGTAGTLASPAIWKVVNALKPATTIAGKAAQGAAVGAGFGATAPVTEGDDYWGTKGTQTATGGILGGAIAPVAGLASRAYSGIKNVMTPSPVKMATRAAGDKVDDVVAALKSQQSGVPGVNLTAGQASVPANSAEFAALQKLVASRDPSRFYGASGVQGQQEAGRLASLRTVSQTPDDLAAAVAARSAAAQSNYGKAFEQAVRADPQLAAMSKNPYFKDALPDAQKLAQARGIDPKESMTEFLHFVKVSLDKQLQKSGDTALGATEKNTVQVLQKQLVDWLGRKNPAYDAARQAHIAASKPINQMKLGQEVEQALSAPSGAERAASFGQSVRKASTTVSKATGKPRIEDLTPQQRNVIEAIENNLKNDAAFRKLATEGAQSMGSRIGADVLPPTGMFKPILSAGRSWVNRLSGMSHEKTIRELAPLMENPKQLAALMEAASPQQLAVIEALVQRATMGGAAAVGATE